MGFFRLRLRLRCIVLDNSCLLSWFFLKNKSLIRTLDFLIFKLVNIKRKWCAKKKRINWCEAISLNNLDFPSLAVILNPGLAVIKLWFSLAWIVWELLGLNCLELAWISYLVIKIFIDHDYVSLPCLESGE